MPNLIYLNQANQITWKESGGDLAMTFSGVASADGQQGATKDFGVAARVHRFHWILFVQFDTAPVVGERIDIYLKTSDGTNWDNNQAEGDAAVTDINKLNNLHWIGSLIVDSTSPDQHMQASGYVEIYAREVAPVIWNATADALDADTGATNNCAFILTEVPLEIQ